MRWPSLILVVALSCRSIPAYTPGAIAGQGSTIPEVAAARILTVEDAPPASPRLTEQVPFGAEIDSWFAGRQNQRLYLQLDRPLYKPGETVQVRPWHLSTRDLHGVSAGLMTLELVDPRGATAQTMDVSLYQGVGSASVELPAGASGGRWVLRATAADDVEERAFVVASYQTPQLRKQLSFVRQAYGAGEEVQAIVELSRSTGGLLAEHPVRALLEVDGQILLDEELRTDASGTVVVRARLPQKLEKGDGLLTVLVEDGGITESISRSVPITVQQLKLRFFPEGGDLVRGLPSRVYVEATTPHGEPADIEGFVIDDRGNEVAHVVSIHDGMGRFGFTPKAERHYSLHLRAPIEQVIALPEAKATGCVLHSYDDFRSELSATRVGVRCSEQQKVTVVGVLRDHTVDAATVTASPTREAVIYLNGERAALQGVMRVTVFSADRQPLAERLIYRNPGRDLQIKIRPDRDAYSPGDRVTLAIETTDAEDRPVAAELALSVVDDALLSLADDQEGTMLSRIYLQPELREGPKDAGFYFDPNEELAPVGLDLVLGTKGYRRFEWAPIWSPPVSSLQAIRIPQKLPVPPQLRARRGDGRHDIPIPVMAQMEEAPVGVSVVADKSTAVRVFPPPSSSAAFTGVRSDFRDAVFWAPRVSTDARGRATVRFPLSDAITTFRVTAEGAGASLLGHSEKTLVSELPVSVSAKFPAAVSAGDRIDLPLTVRSTRDEATEVRWRVAFDSPLLRATTDQGSIALGGVGADTVFIPVEVGNGQGEVELRVIADGGGHEDILVKKMKVVSPGFPRGWTESGEIQGERSFQLELDEVIPGSLTARLALHPSTVANLIEGMEGLIQTPGGCFEQTSSTNWPNVAIMNYLEAHDVEPKLQAQTQAALTVGYTALSGYQVEAGGFETWGSGPGKEVLSAFGLLQFADMKKVYPVDAKILQRDVDYLLAQRDGSGGFKNTGASAHGYGSAPAPVLNGFITYALVATGHSSEIPVELAAQAKVAEQSRDPYVLALAVRSLLGAGMKPKGVARLAALQAKNGSFPGAESSITRSYEANLLVESTALSALALMEAGPRYTRQYSRAVAWLSENRQAHGTWGATQATALALSALSAHAQLSKKPRSGGVLKIIVNGEPMGERVYHQDQLESIELSEWASALHAGTNTIRVEHVGSKLPFSLDVGWNSMVPMSAPGAEVGLSVVLERAQLAMGETVRMTARVSNLTERVVASPIARVGIPAGLQVQRWQLEELKKRGVIAFWETRPREVTLYWDGIYPDEIHEVQLDLTALVPGVYTAPASTAYPYYDNDEPSWVAGGRVVIGVDRPD